MRLSRQQRESAVRRRSSFIVVFALAGLVAWYLDHKGYPPEKSIAGCVVTIVVVGALWAYRKA
jgi:Flp pilus assembly protein TadB